MALHVAPFLSLGLVATANDLIGTYPAVNQLIDPLDERVSCGSHRPQDDDPDTCNGLAATLWEAAVLGVHYHPTMRAAIPHFFKAARGDGPRHEYKAVFDSLTPIALLNAHDTSGGGFNPPIQEPVVEENEKGSKGAKGGKGGKKKKGR